MTLIEFHQQAVQVAQDLGVERPDVSVFAQVTSSGLTLHNNPEAAIEQLKDQLNAHLKVYDQQVKNVTL